MRNDQSVIRNADQINQTSEHRELEDPKGRIYAFCRNLYLVVEHPQSADFQDQKGQDTQEKD